MRILYHYRFSPFARRVRLALAHKDLDAELREARDNPAWGQEAHALVAFRTIPVLVDDGHAMGDSTAIAHWLDRAYPDAPRLWPDGPDAGAVFQVAALVDVALEGLIDLGTRYFPLGDHPAWPQVKGEILGRSQQAAEALAGTVAALGRPTVAAAGWSAADMALLTLTLWCEGWAERAPTSPHIARVAALGFRLPVELQRWSDAHRDRPDVRAL